MNRDASAVLLLRERDGSSEIFLVERSPKLRFFGGYLALPGGVRDPEDTHDNDNDPDLSLRRCAVRELFEETGVLLAGTRCSPRQRRTARQALLADDRSEYERLIRGNPGTEMLTDVCKIRTPPFSPVRYDTLFALARLPAGEVPEIWPGELTSGKFWRPADALAAWRRGEALIVPPVLILLEHMLDHDVGTFVAMAKATAEGYRNGMLHRVRFSPGVIMASVTTPTLPPATTTNCLIVGEQQLFVVDPGAPHAGEQARLTELLLELQAEGRRVAGVLLTHHHPDHVGGVMAITDRFEVTVRGHEETLAALPAGRHGPPLRDGDRIALGVAPDGSTGWFLDALFTPGHAPGHLCFRENRYQALLAGDMVSTVSSIIIDPPDGDMGRYLRSLARLADEPMTTLYPAHGPAVRDGSRVVQHFIAHREARQQQIVDALGNGPATLAQLLPTVYADTDVALHDYAARSLLAGLQLLAEQGRATLRGALWNLSDPTS